MSYEEVQMALSGSKPEMIVTREGKSIRLIDLACMSAEELVASCSVTLKDHPVYLHSCPITEPFEGPTGKYGLGVLWRGAGSIPSTTSPELRSLSAFDCLREAYDHSKAHNGVGWVE